MRMLFDADLSVERLIPALSIESGTRITPEDTLVIFDEVQEVPRAMTSLKMFNEAAPEYDVLATGSALGVAMHPGFHSRLARSVDSSCILCLLLNSCMRAKSMPWPKCLSPRIFR
ncbi:AAA family ATPase [Bifidobacterium longum]|uniref:AAA family ATPase n=1 Tax=Bifidobacterium longum TaxID=216816 RepID=UPI0030F426A1